MRQLTALLFVCVAACGGDKDKTSAPTPLPAEPSPDPAPAKRNPPPVAADQPVVEPAAKPADGAKPTETQAEKRERVRRLIGEGKAGLKSKPAPVTTTGTTDKQR
jgi:hypothetical protein